jgi:Flp pilus assembly protein TadG
VKHVRTIPILRRFWRAREGATAVEFAFVAAPFLLLLMAIVELSLVFIVSTGLDGATAAAARQIRTGEFQNGGATSKDDFQALVCSRLPVLPGTCSSDLYVDVRTFATFNDLSADLQQDGATFNAGNTCFSPGAARDIVMVRTYYMWPLITPGMTAAFANNSDGTKRMLTSVAVFRNEPYNDNPAVGAKC